MALKYSELGWGPIPLRPRDKKPLLDSWKPHQEIKPSPDEISKWWDENPEANIGLITGRPSGIVAIDIDGQKAEPS